MCCCVPSETNLVDLQTARQEYQSYDAQDRDARITALVLGMISLFFFAASCVLYGMGTLPPTSLMGLGMLPYLGGTFFNFLSLGILAGTIIFGMVAAVRTCQKDRLTLVASPSTIPGDG